MNIQIIGGWIQAKRIEQNLTPGHLAAKMGIASALVRAWENGTEEPDTRRLEVLTKILGFVPTGQFSPGTRLALD